MLSINFSGSNDVIVQYMNVSMTSSCSYIHKTKPFTRTIVFFGNIRAMCKLPRPLHHLPVY